MESITIKFQVPTRLLEVVNYDSNTTIYQYKTVDFAEGDEVMVIITSINEDQGTVCLRAIDSDKVSGDAVFLDVPTHTFIQIA